MSADWEQLARYAAERSEEAFTALVNRHLPFVYSAALRQTGDPQLAGDAAQIVFANLAGRAATLTPRGSLAGWLHRDTRFTCLELLRVNRRRAAREQEIMNMEDRATPNEQQWEVLRPVLDAALAELKPDDRDALIMRFMEQRSLKQVAEALDLAEDAARKKVSRALEKLRAIFSRQGIQTSDEALANFLASGAVQAVPAGLAAVVLGVSLAVPVSAASAVSTWSVFELMAMTKVKASVAAVLVATGIGGPLVVQYQQVKRLRSENAALQASLQEQSPPTESLPAAEASSGTMKQAQFAELLRLRGEVGLLRQETNRMAVELAKIRRAENTRPPERPAADETLAAQVARARAEILEPNVPLSQKLEALRLLRGVDARGEDVVRQMLAAYGQTTDVDARADIFRQLHGVMLPEMKALLLQAASNPNEHPQVIEEAVESLDVFNRDPEVARWLEHLAENGPNRKIRAQARESLERQER